jgi:hypothetical protein
MSEMYFGLSILKFPIFVLKISETTAVVLSFFARSKIKDLM